MSKSTMQNKRHIEGILKEENRESDGSGITKKEVKLPIYNIENKWSAFLVIEKDLDKNP